MCNDRVKKAIQFGHPGAEHKSGKIISGTDTCFKEWNGGQHRRKYVRQIGDYINCTGDRIFNRPIDFWCEWEAESISKKAVQKECSYNNQFPHSIHYPIFISKKERANANLKFSGKDFQLKSGINTDPFVFGKEFYYTCCNQKVKLHLERGSLILFGSTVIKGGTRFILDTVFVVRDIYEYGTDEYKNVMENGVFRETVLDLLYDGCNKAEKDSILVGAAYDNPYNGMYSFFPCHESTDSDSFERPTIRDNIHSNICSYIQNTRNVVINDDVEIKKVWDKLVEQCITENYLLGIKAELPQEVKITNSTIDVEHILNSVDNQVKKVNIK